MRSHLHLLFLGWTPLHFAAQGKIVCYDYLLSVGANENAYNQEGNTPKILRAQMGQ